MYQSEYALKSRKPVSQKASVRQHAPWLVLAAETKQGKNGSWAQGFVMPALAV